MFIKENIILVYIVMLIAYMVNDHILNFLYLFLKMCLTSNDAFVQDGHNIG